MKLTHLYKLSFTFALLQLMLPGSFGQNPTFSGRIVTDTTWTADTLEITGDVMIDSNVTLTVMPGTFVHILGYYSIQSYGSIRAIGTISDSIVFTHLDTIQHADTSTIAGGWHGIRLLPRSTNDTSYFKYCKISNGKAVVPGSWIPYSNNPDNLGGNLYALNFGNLIVEDCVIGNGRVKADGGGLYLKSGNYVLINRSNFEYNHSYYVFGGGACIREVESLTVKNCLFYRNTCFNITYNPTTHGGNGGGIAILDGLGYSSYALLENNKFFNNKTSGGILYTGYYNADVIGNIICNNYGLGLWQAHYFNYPLISNNTVINNVGTIWSGIVTSTPDAQLINNIVWGNYAYPNYPIEQIHWGPSVPGPPTVKYCNVEFGFEGEGNIDEEPHFVNPTIGCGPDFNGLLADWSLQDNSPCINTGTPDTTGLFLPELDLAGHPRIYGNRIDMGAYENQHVWVKINDSPAFADQIKVYPNPGTDRIMVALSENTQDAWIELLDGTGQQVLLEPVYANLCIFTPTGLTPGIYFYRIYNKERVFKKGKWVKY
jgi:hypothetical protein